MFQNQQQFVEYLDAVNAELEKAGSAFEDIKKSVQSLGELKQDIIGAELMVPVVGAFSAGKSTLINSFLHSEILPVNITPETALATELRHSTSDYIEAIKADGEADHFDIGDIGSIKEKAQQYMYLKVFLNSEQLREIAPLVLVDMPGFDSPLDAHQRAVLTYLDRGSHYAVLISVEEGTVTRSIQRQLSEFHEFDKAFSVFLSKANLRSESDVVAIAQNIKEQLSDDFDFDDEVVAVDLKGGESLAKMLKAIDPEILFDRRWKPRLEEHFFDLDGGLNTRISALQKDESDNQEAIDELAVSLRELERKKNEMVEDVRTRYSTRRVDSIVNGVGTDLNNAVDELTNVAVNGGEDALQRYWTEIVRASLVRHIKTELDQLNEEIVRDLSSSLKGAEPILDSYIRAGENWDSDDVGHKTGEALRSATSSVAVGLKRTIEAQGVSGALRNRNLYRVTTTALAITTGFVAPLVELVIVFLPDIIGYFRKQQQKAQIHEQLIGTAIPSFKTKLRSELGDSFAEQVNTLINEEAALIDEQIKTKQDEIAAAEQAKKNELQGIEQTIAELTGIRDRIRSLANRAIFP